MTASGPAPPPAGRPVWPPGGADAALAAATVGAALLLLSIAPDASTIRAADLVGGLVAFVLVLVRRAQPTVVLVLAAAGAIGAMASADRPGPLVIATLVILYSFCLRHGRVTSIVVGAVVCAALYAGVLIATGDEPGDERAMIVIPWTAAAVGFADARRSWTALNAAAAARIDAIVQASELSTSQRIAEERMTIARDLHDVMAHNLAVMNVQTGVAAHFLHDDPARAAAALELARAAGRDVLDEVRQLLDVLRTSDSGAPVEAVPTFEAIDGLVSALRNAGLRVHVRHDGAPRPLAAPVSIAAYRVTQEALTNAAKHGAGTVELRTAFDGDELTISTSNPVGPAAAATTSGGLGLVGMRERVTSVGGRLEIDTAGGRFTVRARLPVGSAREAGAG